MRDEKVFEAIRAYEKSGLDGWLFYMEPAGMPAVELPTGAVYAPESLESDADIIKRIKRSESLGRNLFLEEWKPWEPKPGLVY